MTEYLKKPPICEAGKVLQVLQSHEESNVRNKAEGMHNIKRGNMRFQREEKLAQVSQESGRVQNTIR
jgi:hypothetical protein